MKDEECKKKYGDNHWAGLTCLEAVAHLKLMDRQDWLWLLVVDDDVFAFPERLRETLGLMDPSKPSVYGAPGCGTCGRGRKSLCGGGGYIISRINLLRMANLTMDSELPVAPAVRKHFLEHFMSPPMEVWCDVRFGCVAQDVGLRLQEAKGMYGNPFAPNEEEATVSMRRADAPLTLHKVGEAEHMHRLYNQSKREQRTSRGKTIAWYSSYWTGKKHVWTNAWTP